MHEERVDPVSMNKPGDFKLGYERVLMGLHIQIEATHTLQIYSG